MKTCKELENILNDNTCVSIINVYADDLNEMSRFSNLPESQLQIHIEGTEGNIPHFHIQKINGKKENTICHVKLLSAEYLRDRDDPMNVLSSKEKKILNDFMHRVVLRDVNNWSRLVSKWNNINPNHIIVVSPDECPDYTQLKEENK